MAMATESIAKLTLARELHMIPSWSQYCQGSSRQASSKTVLCHGSGGVGRPISGILWVILAEAAPSLCSVWHLRDCSPPHFGVEDNSHEVQTVIDIHATSVCNIRKNDPLAEMIRQTGLIIWDEVTCNIALFVEAVDRTLRFLDNDVPFGSITVAWGGDFKQTLPVVIGAQGRKLWGLHPELLLWPHVKVLHLTENMRVDPNDPEKCSICSVATGCGGKVTSACGPFPPIA